MVSREKNFDLNDAPARPTSAPPIVQHFGFSASNLFAFPPDAGSTTRLTMMNEENGRSTLMVKPPSPARFSKAEIDYLLDPYLKRKSSFSDESSSETRKHHHHVSPFLPACLESADPTLPIAHNASITSPEGISSVNSRASISPAAGTSKGALNPPLPSVISTKGGNRPPSPSKANDLASFKQEAHQNIASPATPPVLGSAMIGGSNNLGSKMGLLLRTLGASSPSLSPQDEAAGHGSGTSLALMNGGSTSSSSSLPLDTLNQAIAIAAEQVISNSTDCLVDRATSHQELGDLFGRGSRSIRISSSSSSTSSSRVRGGGAGGLGGSPKQVSSGDGANQHPFYLTATSPQDLPYSAYFEVKKGDSSSIYGNPSNNGFEFTTFSSNSSISCAGLGKTNASRGAGLTAVSYPSLASSLPPLELALPPQKIGGKGISSYYLPTGSVPLQQAYVSSWDLSDGGNPSNFSYNPGHDFVLTHPPSRGMGSNISASFPLSQPFLRAPARSSVEEAAFHNMNLATKSMNEQQLVSSMLGRESEKQSVRAMIGRRDQLQHHAHSPRVYPLVWSSSQQEEGFAVSAVLNTHTDQEFDTHGVNGAVLSGDDEKKFTEAKGVPAPHNNRLSENGTHSPNSHESTSSINASSREIGDHQINPAATNSNNTSGNRSNLEDATRTYVTRSQESVYSNASHLIAGGSGGFLNQNAVVSEIGFDGATPNLVTRVVHVDAENAGINGEKYISLGEEALSSISSGQFQALFPASTLSPSNQNQATFQTSPHYQQQLGDMILMRSGASHFALQDDKAKKLANIISRSRDNQLQYTHPTTGSNRNLGVDYNPSSGDETGGNHELSPLPPGVCVQANNGVRTQLAMELSDWHRNPHQTAVGSVDNIDSPRAALEQQGIAARAYYTQEFEELLSKNPKYYASATAAGFIGSNRQHSSYPLPYLSIGGNGSGGIDALHEQHRTPLGGDLMGDHHPRPMSSSASPAGGPGSNGLALAQAGVNRPLMYEPNGGLGHIHTQIYASQDLRNIEGLSSVDMSSIAPASCSIPQENLAVGSLNGGMSPSPYQGRSSRITGGYAISNGSSNATGIYPSHLASDELPGAKPAHVTGSAASMRMVNGGLNNTPPTSMIGAALPPHFMTPAGSPSSPGMSSIHTSSPATLAARFAYPPGGGPPGTPATAVAYHHSSLSQQHHASVGNRASPPFLMYDEATPRWSNYPYLPLVPPAIDGGLVSPVISSSFNESNKLANISTPRLAHFHQVSSGGSVSRPNYPQGASVEENERSRGESVGGVMPLLSPQPLPSLIGAAALAGYDVAATSPYLPAAPRGQIEGLLHSHHHHQGGAYVFSPVGGGGGEFSQPSTEAVGNGGGVGENMENLVASLGGGINASACVSAQGYQHVQHNTQGGGDVASSAFGVAGSGQHNGMVGVSAAAISPHNPTGLSIRFPPASLNQFYGIADGSSVDSHAISDSSTNMLFDLTAPFQPQHALTSLQYDFAVSSRHAGLLQSAGDSQVTTNDSSKGSKSSSKSRSMKKLLPRTNDAAGNVSPEELVMSNNYRGCVAFIAKDQAGGRMLQRKLDEQDPYSKSLIYNEVLENTVDLMTDPFGNYLCQKLMDVCDKNQLYRVIDKVTGDLVKVSLNMHGTRAVQKMIEVLKEPEQIQRVINSLKSSVVTLVKDLNGNHVIQKCLSVFKPQDCNFIYHAIVGNCYDVATHRHGCCVLQRCVDAANPEQRMMLVGEICSKSQFLVTDPFGNYVVQYALDLKDSDVVGAVVQQLKGYIVSLSKQKFSSNVIEKCLKVGTTEQRREIIVELLQEGGEALKDMLLDSYANYVVQRALEVAQYPELGSLLECIGIFINELQSSQSGKRVACKLLKRYSQFPAFGTNGAGASSSHAQSSGSVRDNSNGATNSSKTGGKSNTTRTSSGSSSFVLADSPVEIKSGISSEGRQWSQHVGASADKVTALGKVNPLVATSAERSISTPSYSDSNSFMTSMILPNSFGAFYLDNSVQALY